MRSARSEWSIYKTTEIERFTLSVNDFLTRLKKPGKDHYEINYSKKSRINHKIVMIALEIDKKSQDEYTIQLLLASDSHNEDIYNDFKNFGSQNNLSLQYGDYGKDNWITFGTPKFTNPAELGPYIQLCNEYDSTIPLEILDELKLACGLPLVPSKQEFKQIIAEKGYKHALKLADDCSNKDLYIISLADILFKKKAYEDAASCYELITTKDMNLYKKAQYQLGSMVFNFSDANDYDSPREHARASLQYFAEADDYLDSIALSKRTFNCLCTGSYDIGNCPVPYPYGAKSDVLFTLGDYIYSIHKKANLIADMKEIKISSPNFFGKK